MVGNAGRAVEVIVGGLELATLVFMDLEEDEQGDIELKGDRYRKGALQIIDTGYGLERFCWAAAGTPTIYEAIYPEVVRHLKDSIGFEDLLEGTGLDLDRVLADISRLMGIMNIEPGSDAGAMQDHLIERLEAWYVDRHADLRADHGSALAHLCDCGSSPRCDAYDGRWPRAIECESGGIC